MMSVYFGCITMVLKLPFTRAASTKGAHRKRGFDVTVSFDGLDGGKVSAGKVAEVGVVERFGGRGALCIDRLLVKYLI